jgi:hypothetical protein
MIRSIRKLAKKIYGLSFMVVTFLGSSLSIIQNSTDRTLN